MGIIESFYGFFEVSRKTPHILIFKERIRIRRSWSRNFLRIVFTIIILIALLIGINEILARFNPENLTREKKILYME